MSDDTVPRLAPRSAGAIADVELLRAATTEIVPPAPVVGPSLAVRIRSLLARLARPEA